MGGVHPVATLAARTAWSRPPGSSTSSADDHSPVAQVAPSAPKTPRTRTPVEVAASPAPQWWGPAPVKRCVRRPVTRAATGRPTTNPPVGPSRTPSPPRPPVSSGSPRATRATSTSRQRNPRRAPRTAPASTTPTPWAVSGTPEDSGTAGTSPRTATTATKTATTTASRRVLEPARTGGTGCDVVTSLVLATEVGQPAAVCGDVACAVGRVVGAGEADDLAPVGQHHAHQAHRGR